MKKRPQSRVIRFLLENSAFLIIGAAIGLVWANVDHESYEFIKETPAFHINHVPVSLHFLINDIAMAFFFLLAGKEIREAMLPKGALSSVRTAALPITATLGGMAGPAIIYFAGTLVFNAPELTRGWAIPMATDIAFSYLIARLVFPQIGGKSHPAIVFLLLLAIADDAGGLIVLASFYPQEVHNLLPFLHGIHPMSVFVIGAGIAIALALFIWKKLKITNFWPYLMIPGVISWLAFHEGGIHPALALVPLAWCMPHEHSDVGIWAVGESEGQDTLNRMENWWKSPVELILGLFGFVNAGVAFSALGLGTWLVFFGLLFGKPIGIVLFTKIGQAFGLRLPKGMHTMDLIIVGIAAGIGFTVALFVSVVAFPAGAIQDSVKMGALFSFIVAPITIIASLILGIRRRAIQNSAKK
ncbi:MAG: Na+/H+ antiporter NhaA [Acidobacteria bacterium]|nr:Na+/H+ antiporter NhaA [Acidobacteriota bacterium]